MLKPHLTLRVMFLLLRMADAFNLRTPIATKVHNEFPDGTQLCLLDTVDLRKFQLRTTCVAVCYMNPKCYLACTDKGLCKIYSAVVSHYWTSSGIPLGECFSYWTEKKDITAMATFTGSSNYATLTANFAGNGYGCWMEYANRFYSYYTNREWVLADFGAPVCIDRLLVLFGLETSRGLYDSDVIRVRVGNDTGDDGDFSVNPVLMTSKGPSYYGEIILFHGQTSLIGRYVSIQSLKMDFYLIIHEMKIISC